MKIIIVTGTNGKSTTAFNLYNLLMNDKKTALIMSHHIIYNNNDVKHNRTTPLKLELIDWLNKFQNWNYDYVILEFTCSGIIADCLTEYNIEAILFTGLYRDHFDFCGNFHRYKSMVVNWINKQSCKIFTLPKFKNWFTNSVIECNPLNLLNEFDFNNENYGLISSYLKHFKHKENIQSYSALKGRVNFIDDNLLIDYAHTPEEVRRVLKFLRTRYDNINIIFAISAGGDTDYQKRPLMMGFLIALSDYVILSKDPNRLESFDKIVNDMTRQYEEYENTHYKIIEDRTEALKYARSLGGLIVSMGLGEDDPLLNLNNLQSD